MRSSICSESSDLATMISSNVFKWHDVNWSTRPALTAMAATTNLHSTDRLLYFYSSNSNILVGTRALWATNSTEFGNFTCSVLKYGWNSTWRHWPYLARIEAVWSTCLPPKPDSFYAFAFIDARYSSVNLSCKLFALMTAIMTLTVSAELKPKHWSLGRLYSISKLSLTGLTPLEFLSLIIDWYPNWTSA